PVGPPFRRHQQPPIQHRVALGTALANKDTGLAVGSFAQFPTVLPLHTHRMAPLLRESTPTDHPHALGGTPVHFHCFPVLVQQSPIVPLSCTAKGLHGPHGLG